MNQHENKFADIFKTSLTHVEDLVVRIEVKRVTISVSCELMEVYLLTIKLLEHVDNELLEDQQ